MIFQGDSYIRKLPLSAHILLCLYLSESLAPRDECLSVFLASERILNFPGVLGVLNPSEVSDMEMRFLGEKNQKQNVCILQSIHWVKCSLPSGHSDMLFSYTQRTSARLFRALGVIQAYGIGALQAQSEDSEDKQLADGNFLTVRVMVE